MKNMTTQSGHTKNTKGVRLLNVVVRGTQLHNVIVKEIQPRNMVVGAKEEQSTKKLTWTERDREREREDRRRMANSAGAPTNTSTVRLLRMVQALAGSLAKLQARKLGESKRELRAG